MVNTLGINASLRFILIAEHEIAKRTAADTGIPVLLSRRLPTSLRESELDQVLGFNLSPFGHPVSGAHASTECPGKERH